MPNPEQGHIVYKYFPKERLSFLLDGLVRFTQPGDLNDPFELLPALSDELLYETVRRHPISNQVNQIKGGQKGFGSSPGSVAKGSTLSHEQLREIFISRVRQYFDNRVGIFSLSKRWDSPPMWAHYTGGHRGFCVGFCKDRLSLQFKENPLNVDGKTNLDKLVTVKYSDKRVAAASTEDEQIDPQIFYTKSIAWQYEEEVRIFANLCDRTTVKDDAAGQDEGGGKEPKDRKIYLFKISHDSIAEIIIGMNAKKELEKEITRLAKCKQFRIYKAGLSHDTFILQRTRVFLD